MTVVVFVNNRDRDVAFLGKALYSLLDRQYFVFTREESDYPFCPVNKTMDKLKDIADHAEGDRIIVCFGCRVFPNNIKNIEKIATQYPDQNIVLLKKLQGSKTWVVNSQTGEVSFENERIADCGIFVLRKADLTQTPQKNFNTFIRYLLGDRQLTPHFVDFWVFSNSQNKKRDSRRGK